MPKDKYQELFELITSIGEILEGDLHIIDTTEHHYCGGPKKFRIYHKEGYCFDVMKEIETEDEDTGETLTYYYDFYTEWDGFIELDVDQAIELISKHGNKL